MSGYCDEQYEVYEEIKRKARKTHVCAACSLEILPRHYYYSVFILFDGSAETIKRCLRCQAIHDHLKGLGHSDDLWPDERLNCGEEYQQHWGHAPPPEIARLAFVTPEEMQREIRICHNPA